MYFASSSDCSLIRFIFEAKFFHPGVFISEGSYNLLLVTFILITLIITATLFLITAGYDNNQIAPAIGLFGTVAGYLLGKSVNKNNTPANEP